MAEEGGIFKNYNLFECVVPITYYHLIFLIFFAMTMYMFHQAHTPPVLNTNGTSGLSLLYLPVLFLIQITTCVNVNRGTQHINAFN